MIEQELRPVQSAKSDRTKSVGARRKQRRREIGQALARNGFAWLMVEAGLGDVLDRVASLRSEYKSLRSESSETAVTQPERVRRTLEDLGPTFVKLGQTLSTRPDLVPPEYVEELSKLQDNAPRVDYEAIAATIVAELGAPPDEIFTSFSVEPRAAASIGQVHDAVLPDGTSVVVKVQRPGITPVIEDDLTILADAARFLTANSSFGKQHDLDGYVAEFAVTLRNELDYQREGLNADRVRASFADDPSLRVPKVYWDFTTRRVLTMEVVEGIKITDLAALDAAGLDRHALAERCAHIALTQVLEHRFFHADPHPGNFVVQPDGSIGLLDYGMVGDLDNRLAEELVRLSVAVSRGDADRLADEMLSIGAAPGRVDRQELRRDLSRLLQQYSGRSLGELSATRVFEDGATVARRHGLRLPSDLALLAKVAAMDEGLGAHLDPDFNLFTFAQPYLARFWGRSHSPREIARRMREGAIDLAELGADLPQRLRRLLIQVDRGEVTVTSRVELPEPTARRFEQAANRISVSILAAGAVIGLSVLASMGGIAGGTLGAFLTRSALAIGIACCVWLTGSFWRSRR